MRVGIFLVIGLVVAVGGGRPWLRQMDSIAAMQGPQQKSLFVLTRH